MPTPFHLHDTKPHRSPGNCLLRERPVRPAAAIIPTSTTPAGGGSKSGIDGKPLMKRRAAKLVSVSKRSRHLAYTKPDPALPEIGVRLALARRALTLTRFQMARLIGTDVRTWGTYEAGLQRIPVEQALKLSPYGIPLDWVYQGRMADLHPHIRAKIRQLAS